MITREFADLGQLAAHFASLELSVKEAEHRGLERVARVIARDAREQIGHYQESVGPFPAWAELADSTELEKSRSGFPVDAPLLRTGELRDSIQYEVHEQEAVIGSKSDVAAYQEFGTATIPPRPFIGPAAFKSQDEIQKVLGAALVEGITGGAVIHESLGYDLEVKP